MDLCQFGCGFHFRVRRIRAAIADVVTDGIVEQHGVLRHHADGFAEGFLGNVRNVLFVNCNATACDVIKAVEQP